jgi:zinc protease
MKKVKLSLLLAFVFLLNGASGIAQSGKIEFKDNPEKKAATVPANVTANTVLAKYIQSIGGESNINKIKDIVFNGTMQVQGMSLKMNMLFKFPGKFLQEITMNGQTVQKQLLNGDKGRSSGMGGSKDITGDELEKLKFEADPFPETKYDKLNYKTELKGTEKIDGKDAYIVEITSPKNDVNTEYYSVETGLKIRSISIMEAQGQKITQTTDVIEYSAVNGVQFPKKMKITAGPQIIEVTVTTIEINSNISDELFN